MTAPLPRGGNCHSGSKLLQQGTVRLLAPLWTLRIFISKGQVMRPLIDGQDHFHDDASNVLRAGLLNCLRRSSRQ